MDLITHLASFVRIVDTGSLTGAARALGLSLPAVSRQLGALEAELGTRLIARSTRRLEVTEAGRGWYASARRILDELEQARGRLGGTRQVRGRVALSAPVSFGLAWVVPRLPALAARHPGLAVDVRLEDRLLEPTSAPVDVLVRAGATPPDSAALTARPLCQFRRVLVAAPAYLERRGEPREVAALAEHDGLAQLTDGGALDPWRLVSDGRELVMPVRGPLRVSAPLALRALALAGAGVAFLPEWLVEGELADGRLRRILPAWSSDPIGAWALFRAELRRAPRVRALVEALRAA